MSSSRGAKRHHEEEHEEHVNHEAWVIPYADVLTLLMALFLVLFALGQPDQEKLDLAAQSFRKELNSPSILNFGNGSGGVGPLASGGDSVLDGVGPKPAESEGTRGGSAHSDSIDDGAILPPPVLLDPRLPDAEEVPPVTTEPAGETGDGTEASTAEVVEETFGDPLTEVELRVRERAVATGLTSEIGFRRETRGLVVTIVTDQVLFAPGEATIQPEGFAILDVVVDALMDVPNDVTIEGHTDTRPISTSRFPSNWELSTTRATSVLRYLVDGRGFPPTRVSAAGYADTHPIDDGTTPDALAKNRRVEIVVRTTT